MNILLEACHSKEFWRDYCALLRFDEVDGEPERNSGLLTRSEAALLGVLPGDEVNRARSEGGDDGDVGAETHSEGQVVRKRQRQVVVHSR